MVWTQPHSESVRVPRLSEVQVGGVESKQSQEEVKLKGKAKCGRRAPSEEPWCSWNGRADLVSECSGSRAGRLWMVSRARLAVMHWGQGTGLMFPWDIPRRIGQLKVHLACKFSCYYVLSFYESAKKSGVQTSLSVAAWWVSKCYRSPRKAGDWFHRLFLCRQQSHSNTEDLFLRQFGKEGALIHACINFSIKDIQASFTLHLVLSSFGLVCMVRILLSEACHDSATCTWYVSSSLVSMSSFSSRPHL